jgi:creatinine amidohydrolase
MGFKGTVTLSDQTLLAILMDVIGSLAEHGVKRFVLSNHHGGNTQTMNLAIQLAKREYRVMVHAPNGPSKTELAKLVDDRQKRYWDVHSGPTETRTALTEFPDLVEMWRLKDWTPTLAINPKLMEYMNPDRPDFEVVSQVRAACGEPDTDDFTSSGIYGVNDPRTSDVEEAKRRFEERVKFFTDFITEWKKIPIPPAYT